MARSKVHTTAAAGCLQQQRKYHIPGVFHSGDFITQAIYGLLLPVVIAVALAPDARSPPPSPFLRRNMRSNHGDSKVAPPETAEKRKKNVSVAAERHSVKTTIRHLLVAISRMILIVTFTIL